MVPFVTVITARRDSLRGYTLVEVLVSILILLIIMLGLIQAMSIYLTHNVKVLLRNEAVKVAQSCLEDLRNQRDCAPQVIRQVRNFQVTFNVNAPSWASLADGANNVTVRVTYSYRGENYSYTLNSVIYK